MSLYHRQEWKTRCHKYLIAQITRRKAICAYLCANTCAYIEFLYSGIIFCKLWYYICCGLFTWKGLKLLSWTLSPKTIASETVSSKAFNVPSVAIFLRLFFSNRADQFQFVHVLPLECVQQSGSWHHAGNTIISSLHKKRPAAHHAAGQENLWFYCPDGMEAICHVF